MAPRVSRVTTLAGAALLALGLLIGLPAGALAAGATATFAKTSDWGTGFVANYTITNTGTTQISGWTLGFDLGATQRVTSAWNGVLSSSGNHYVLTNESWNPTIAPGAQVTVGFEGTYSGTWADPANCTLNGASCAGGGGGPDTTRPSVPTGLRVTGTTSSSISLAWTASTDDVGVTGYNLREGTTVVATTATTGVSVAGLAPGSTHTYRVSALDAAGNESDPSAAVTATTQQLGQGGGSFASAPYYMPNDNDPPDLAEVTAASGQTHFVFAFMLARGNSACEPAWDATVPLAQDAAIKAKVDGVRARGGDVVVSFGGALGTKLGQACADATATAGAIQQVVDRYALKAIDLNIEEPEIENDRAVNNELGAAKLLKQRNPGLTVFLTLPTTQTGVNFFGRGVIEKARDQAVPVDAFTIMPFDMGGDAAMGDNAVSTAEAYHSQLMSIFPGISSAQAYRLLGLSLMNGRTDIGEFYRQADYQTVLGYAQSHHIGRLSSWSVNRDRQCATPEGGATSGTCSSVTQAAWEFTRLLAPFSG